ncbi:MAG: hypothetical protein ACREJN_12225 [Nitrospiraceae bacterium]
MNNTGFLESVITEELAQVGSCTIEELYEKVPYYSSIQVFSVVDKLTREGSLVFIFLTPSRYLVSLVPCRSTEARHVTAAESQAST